MEKGENFESHVRSPFVKCTFCHRQFYSTKMGIVSHHKKEFFFLLMTNDPKSFKVTNFSSVKSRALERELFDGVKKV